MGIKKSYKKISEEDDVDKVVRNRLEDKCSIEAISVQKQRDILKYNFRHARRGLAVLIMYNTFEKQTARAGAFKDSRQMENIFEKALDFEVKKLKMKVPTSLQES